MGLKGHAANFKHVKFTQHYGAISFIPSYAIAQFHHTKISFASTSIVL